MTRNGPEKKVLSRYSPEEDVDREIRAHLEMRAEELMEEGWSPEEARREARARFGNRDRLARQCREISKRHLKKQRRARMWEGIWQDLRYGARALRRAPGFTAVAVLTLAIGIGANTAVFSVVNGVLLSPLPFPDAHEIVVVSERMPSGGSAAVAWPNFQDWRAESESFDGLAAFGSMSTTVLGGAEPAWAGAAWVTRDFWTVFPVSPVSGRLTGGEDHREGTAPVAVVSQRFARRFLSEGNPVGQVLEARGIRFEVVGVLPPDFDYPGGTDFWVPAEITSPGRSRTAHNWRVVGRLKPGITPSEAWAEIDPLTRRLAASDPQAGSRYLAAGAVVTSLREETVGSARQPLLLLLGAAAFVLLVACTNLASTFLARGTGRAKELALRSALGAHRHRIARLLFTEAFVLAVSGGLVGVGLALGLQRGIRALGADFIPRLEAVSLDGRVLLFAMGATVATAFVFGLLPAFKAVENDQARTLRTEGRGNEGYRGRTWNALVIAEVALALVLLVGSGLLIRSFSTLLSQDAGFDDRDVALTTLVPSGIKYPDYADGGRFWSEMLDRAATLPGAEAVGVLSSRPVAGSAPNGQIELDGDPEKHADAVYVVASEGAFDALDIPVLRGRLFDASDGPEGEHMVVVSQSFADTYWPGEDPIGRQVSGGGMDNFWSADDPVFGTVVGVVGDVRYRELSREGGPTVYWSFRQRPARIHSGGHLLVESSSGDPGLVAASLRRAVADVDPDVAVRIDYLRGLVSDSLGRRRFILVILTVFAGTALLLAGVGIYGVVSYSVARRTRETGIRLALGATRSRVRRKVVGEALKPVAVGLVLGLGGSVALARVISGLLYQVQPTDPPTLAAVVLILFITAWGASWAPALRSTRVDPGVTMRAE